MYKHHEESMEIMIKHYLLDDTLFSAQTAHYFQFSKQEKQHILFSTTHSILQKQRIVVVFFMESSSAFYKEGYDWKVIA